MIENEILRQLMAQSGGSVEMSTNEPDLEKIQKAKKDYQNESLMALLAGGAAELLSGDTGGEIAKYSGDLAMQRLGKADALSDAESKAMMKVSSPNGSKRFQQAKLELRDKQTGESRVIPALFNQVTGEYEDMSRNPIDTDRYDVSAGYKFDVKTDPRYDELVRVGQMGGVKRVGSEDGKPKFSEKQKKVFRKTEDRLLKNPEYKKAKGQLNAALKAMEYLQAENPIADAAQPVVFARMFGEVGNLAVQEQAKFEGSREWLRIWDRLKYRASNGLLTEEDRSDLMEIAKITEAYTQRAIGKEVDAVVKSESQLEDISKEDLYKYLGGYRPKTEKSGISTKKGRARMEKTAGAIKIIKTKDGKERKFKRKANGKYVEIE